MGGGGDGGEGDRLAEAVEGADGVAGAADGLVVAGLGGEAQVAGVVSAGHGRCRGVGGDGFEGVDDAGEVVVDAAVVGGESLVAFGFGGGDEHGGGVGVAAVDVEELDGGLEVGAGEAGVGVGAVLLRWPAAVAVGEGGLDLVEVVLDPFGGGGGGGGIEVEDAVR